MSSIRDKLSQYTTCDVADALLKLGHKHGGFLENFSMISPGPLDQAKKIIGEVYTVKFVPKEDTTSPKVDGHYIDSVPAHSVLFISQPEPHINAVYGGLMSLRAQSLGVEGVVVDGRIRDVDEHRGIGFPVFSRGVGTTAATAVCRASATQVPCRFNSSDQEAWVRPGDYIIADINGVVVVPAAQIEKILEMIPAMIAADEKVAAAIIGGMPVFEAFGQFRGK